MSKLRGNGDSDNFDDISFEDIHFNLSLGNTMIISDLEAVSIIKLVMYTIYEKRIIIIKNEPNILINNEFYIISMGPWHE